MDAVAWVVIHLLASHNSLNVMELGLTHMCVDDDELGHVIALQFEVSPQ